MIHRCYSRNLCLGPTQFQTHVRLRDFWNISSVLGWTFPYTTQPFTSLLPFSTVKSTNQPNANFVFFHNFSGIHHAKFGKHGYFFSWENDVTKNLTVTWFTGRNICRRHCMDLVSLGENIFEMTQVWWSFDHRHQNNKVMQTFCAKYLRRYPTDQLFCDKHKFKRLNIASLPQWYDKDKKRS